MSTPMSVPLTEANNRWRFDWLLPLLFKPRQTYRTIIEMLGSVSFTPIFLFALSSLILSLVIGGIKDAANAAGQVQLPSGFEWYTPEQQAQYFQAASATSGPVFVYLLPAIMSLAKVFLGWVLLSWILHLVLTMFGGRGSSQQASNIVAWAYLPFVIRNIVQILVVWSSNSLINTPGLSGFTPEGEGTLYLYLSAILSNIDIYFIWFVMLCGIGLSQSSQLRPGKAWFAVLLTFVIIQLILATPVLIAAQFNDLTVMSPFF